MPRLFTINKTRIYLYCTIAAIVILSTFFLLPAIKHFIVSVLTFPSTFVSNNKYLLRTKKNIFQENSVLKDRAAELSLQVERLRDLREENKRLRKLLRLKERVEFETISAEVIAADPNEWVGSFVINRGTDDGLKKNSAVCSAEGLLGKVVDPRRGNSSVMLLTHPGFKIGGMTIDTRVKGVIVGGGKGTVRMLYMPLDAEVKKGSVVMTLRSSDVFPKGIIIGDIISVGKSKTGLYKYAVIRPSADPFKQEEVLCIK